MQKFRRLIQVLFTLITNAYLLFPFGPVIYQGPLKGFCHPGLHCYSCPASIMSCPVGSFQNMIASVRLSVQAGTAHFGAVVLGYLGIIGVMTGRFTCGWLCPFGLIQDLLHKIPSPKFGLPHFLNYGRYVVLAVFVVLMPLFLVDDLGLGQPWFCKLLCPSGTLTGALPLLVLKPSLWQNIGFYFLNKVTWLVIIIIGAILSSRFFCRIFCPLGGFYGLFNRVSFFCLQYDEEKCVHCLACERRCPTGCKPYKDADSTACINCLKCVDTCRFGALAFRMRPAKLPTLPRRSEK
jgi:ferredoxin-type protein NapH